MGRRSGLKKFASHFWPITYDTTIGYGNARGSGLRLPHRTESGLSGI
jgi:hypothetical protein